MQEVRVKPIDELIEQLLDLRQHLLQEPADYPVRIWGLDSSMIGGTTKNVKPAVFADYGDDLTDNAWATEQKYWGVCIKGDENGN